MLNIQNDVSRYDGRVHVIPIDEPGEIISIRRDDTGRFIITVKLDDENATPDGFYTARCEELL